MKVNLFFAWFDFWVGAYWDRKNRILYVLPIPCLGFKIKFASRDDAPTPVSEQAEASR